MKSPLEKAVSVSIDRLMNYRFGLESHGKLPPLSERKEIFEKHYISEFAPKSAAEYIWLAGEFRLRTLPVIGWLPTQQPAREPFYAFTVWVWTIMPLRLLVFKCPPKVMPFMPWTFEVLEPG